METADQFFGLAFKIAAVLGFAVSVVVALLATRFATKGELAAVSATAAETKMKVAVIEQALAGLPNKDSMHELALAVERLRGDLKGGNAELAGKLVGMGGTLERIDVTLERHENIMAAVARER